jgi:hypothetical protein
MAQHILASVYARNGKDLVTPSKLPAVQGVSVSLPVQGIRILPVQETITANGVTINSIIELAPTGLNQPIGSFYSAATVATLNTAANA